MAVLSLFVRCLIMCDIVLYHWLSLCSLLFTCATVICNKR